jgi:hypothetical protein
MCENGLLSVLLYDAAPPRSPPAPSRLTIPAGQDRESHVTVAKRPFEYVQGPGLELWSGLPNPVLRHRNYRLARSRARHACIEPKMQETRKRQQKDVMKRIRRRCLWVGRCEACELRRDGRVGGTSDAVQTPCGASNEC